MRIEKESSGIVQYRGKEYRLEQLIGDRSEKGLFEIKQIHRVFVEQEDVEKIFKDYKVGQELAPRFGCLKVYNGSSLKKFRNPKVATVLAENVLSAETVIRMRREDVQEIVDNCNDVLDLIK